MKNFLLAMLMCGGALWTITPALATTVAIGDPATAGGIVDLGPYSDAVAKYDAASGLTKVTDVAGESTNGENGTYDSNIVVDSSLAGQWLGLSEPGVSNPTNDPSLMSDLLWVALDTDPLSSTDGQYVIFAASDPFTSGVLSGLSSTNMIDAIVETPGIWQDVGTYFGLSSNQFLVVSDAEAPLPAALPLFATGLGILGLLGLRRKKRAAALAA